MIRTPLANSIIPVESAETQVNVETRNNVLNGLHRQK